MRIIRHSGPGRLLAILIVTAGLAAVATTSEAANRHGGSSPSSSPTISGSPQLVVTVGAPYSFRPSATDPRGKLLTFSVQNKPSWAIFSIVTGELAGTPTSSDAGTDGNIVISASDGRQSAALPPFSIQVTAPAPTVTPLTSTVGAATLSWYAPTQNVDGTALTDLAGYNIYYGTSATAMTQKININTVGILTYVISNLSSGTWYFAITAVNSAGIESSPSEPVSKTI
jgi:hypothetical protein